MFHVRLQDGPFDGERLEGDDYHELPPALWVERCRKCGLHAVAERTPKGEKYRRDDQCIDGWHIYVFTDERIGAGDGGLSETVREPVTA